MARLDHNQLGFVRRATRRWLWLWRAGASPQRGNLNLNKRLIPRRSPYLRIAVAAAGDLVYASDAFLVILGMSFNINANLTGAFMKSISIAARIMATAAFLLGASIAARAQSGAGVLTHLNDIRRTGWNNAETILTPATISAVSNKFGVVATVNNLDDTVEAQPLIVQNVQITCPPNQTIVTCAPGLSGLYNVVYVATVANTVYAINANNGQILLHRNFGISAACGGIKSTPVIDPVSGTLYVMTHTVVVSATPKPKYTLHALSVGSLMDNVTPFDITASNTFHTLTDGTVYGIDDKLNCQRSALLLVGGRIYAGFRGNEYLNGSIPQSGPTRGWLLGWTASTLAPLPPLVTDAEATAATGMFLSSIWMSGSGIASDGSNLYFSTGNSDSSGTSYDPVKNVEESVVKVTPNLTVASIFTPSNFAALDKADFDLGSGGVLVIPSSPPLVVAAGKDGRMFLLNSNSLGGYTPGGPDRVLDMHNIGACWCTPSYFMGSDGIGRIVSSGGNSVMTWKIMQTGTPPTPHLVQEGVGQIAISNQDPGFFTTVSSNGTAANHSGIIWAVGRPTIGSTSLTLYAFDATPVSGTLPLLGQYPAGTWTLDKNATIVPVVSNGKVYVGSSGGVGAGALTIFGFKP
ncbi:MAG: hypothetical protein ACREC0_14545 [Methylocella sp.]